MSDERPHLEQEPPPPERIEESTPENVISQLRRSYDKMTLSQKRIAEVIVEDPGFVAFATVDQLAARLEVSPSTIVRCAYRMGLKGYPGLQERVRELFRSQLQAPAAGADETGAYVERLGDGVYAQTLAHDLDIHRRTSFGLHREQLDQAVDALTDARRVYLVGGATSQSLALFMSQSLSRVRPDVVLLPSQELAIGSLLDMTGEDALLAFTFPPYAAKTLHAVTWSKQQGATAIAVTDSPISPVGQRVDVVISVVVSGYGTQNSLVAAMSVANVLLNGVSGRSGSRVERYERSAGLGSEWGMYLLSGDDDQ